LEAGVDREGARVAVEAVSEAPDVVGVRPSGALEERSTAGARGAVVHGNTCGIESDETSSPTSAAHDSPGPVAEQGLRVEHETEWAAELVGRQWAHSVTGVVHASEEPAAVLGVSVKTFHLNK